ncbi:hypothetical protein DC522_26885 [Microvirga sp. KLBC 81]|uniref:glycosyltransferase n=1 Tax=Microvirga sp. KLBC 81 TaxID=1862707 RepID=UPI000D51BEA6|nr:glycosyltransferase [Microvirga sp. KLBC 81]PVE21373.1 hypothetical protein DC522_26885 [Microvirga sp. KLBC 81]
MQTGSTKAEFINPLEMLLDDAWDPLFWRPAIMDVPSAWYGHVPFAHWLVRHIKPRVLVELGTHAGVSYSAFCSTVARDALASRCFAVDSWEGDEQAGFYPEEIYRSLKEFNDSHYRGFSTLLRSTFDEAVNRFEDGTVDLLHIDGFHSYEAVSHDFETWKRKLSDRAVVLFHDTNEYKEGFGVWRFWGELKSQYPSFEFLHSHGLGVLAFGSQAPRSVLELCGLSEDDANTIRDRFQQIGEQWRLHFKVTNVETKLSEQKEMLIQQRATSAAMTTEKNRATSERDRAISERDRAISWLKAADEKVAQRDAEIQNLRRQLYALRRQNYKISWLDFVRQQLGHRRNRRLLASSPLFDREWYLSANPDVREAKIDPLNHYLQNGGFEGRMPSPHFDSAAYLRHNRDIALLGLNPLVHFLLFGEKEGRKPKYSALDEQMVAKFEAEIKGSNVYQSLITQGPLISIVLPTRNRRDYVTNAIRSVLAQTYSNWELIVVDDGSTDGTFDMLAAEYSDARIKLIREEPKGVSAARNTALRNAQGSYIAYIDSDNVWKPEFLAFALTHLVRTKADLCYAGLEIIGDTGLLGSRLKDFDYDELSRENFIDLNIIMHTRDLYDTYGGFDESLQRMVDWDLLLRYTKTSKVVSAPFIGAEYDNTGRSDRITKKEGLFWKYVILNKNMLDWDALRKEVETRSSDVISIVIPVYGQIELTEECLQSIFTQPAGAAFEIIVVDNGSDERTVERLEAWSRARPEITLVRNKENLNFALGCNIGFAASRGRVVVFLNNDTIVTPGWLAPLAQSLEMPGIGAVQPKLVYPDETIQCIGITFSSRSAIGYPIYAGHPGDAPHVNRSASRQAVTAACIAVRAADFADLRGFDPSFVNGQEDVDFCLRLQHERGLTCWYTAESKVVHQESKTPGRGLNIRNNRLFFQKRWGDRIVADDLPTYKEDGFVVTRWEADNATFEKENLANFRPRLRWSNWHSKNAENPVQIVIKIGCPSPEVKEEWGDYHFAKSLASALERLGCRCRIDFLKDWNRFDDLDDVNIVLRGLSEFQPQKNAINLMWMISHPDKVEEAELSRYDHVFVASTTYAATLAQGLGDRVSPLLQCTDPMLFLPEPSAAKQYDALFVGNSRNVFRRVVKDAIESGIDVAIFGTRWEQFICSSRIRGQNIPNRELALHYNAARVVLNDHWTDMAEKGFVSNRIFDVLACGVPIVSDHVEGLPEEFKSFVQIFGNDRPLEAAINAVLNEGSDMGRKRIAFAQTVRTNHSFDERARVILREVNRLLKISPEAVRDRAIGG